jgi:hypothetical protein
MRARIGQKVAWQVELAISDFRLAISFASASRGSVKKREQNFAGGGR